MKILWTPEEDKQLKEFCLIGTPVEQISTVLGRTYNACLNRCRYLKIKNRYKGSAKKYTVNEKFWDKPNPINCFFCGCVSSDGNLHLESDKNFQNIGELRWQLHPKDICLLEDFKKITEFSGPIRKYVTSSGQNTAVISIRSQRWNKDLMEKFNIFPRKTYITQVPNNLSGQLIFSFLIGYLMGDGCVHLAKSQKRVDVTVASSSMILLDYFYEFLKMCFPQTLTNKPFPGPKKSKSANYSVLGVHGIRAVCLVAYLRQYELPYLARKFSNPKILVLEEEMRQKYPHFFDFSHLPPPVKSSELLIPQ